MPKDGKLKSFHKDDWSVGDGVAIWIMAASQAQNYGRQHTLDEVYRPSGRPLIRLSRIGGHS